MTNQFQTQTNPKCAQGGSAPFVSAGLLQRKCACGGAAGMSGECAECRETFLQRKASFGSASNPAISQPGDATEREADRIADAVVSGAGFIMGTSKSAANLQRQTPAEPGHLPPEAKYPPEPGPSEEEKYKEAAKKIAEALRATKAGKELEAQAAQMGEKFLDSVEGKVITGAAIGGALAAAIATNADLPDLPIPAIPLDFIKPGLKAKLTWQGPTRDPKNASLTLTTKSGVSVAAEYKRTEGKEGKPGEERAGLTLTIPLGGSSEKKKPGSERDKYRAETARLQAEQAKFREGLKTLAEQKQDKAFWDMYWKSKMRDPLNPLALPVRPQESSEIKEEKKDEEWLSRKEKTPGTSLETVPPVVNEVLNAPGRPLDGATQKFFAIRLGHDFSHVRIHTDARAAESARKVNALAYTVGDNVVFGAGQYAPHSTAGQRLLAHELAHVVQQSSSTNRPGKGIDNGPADPFEQAADHIAENVMAKDHDAVAHSYAPARMPARVLQRYRVPGNLACSELVDWLNANSPYTPEWAETQCNYNFNGGLTVSSENVARGVKLRAKGHNKLTVTVDCPVDRPEWSPSRRANRDAEVTAWRNMRQVLDAHEGEHRKIGQTWKGTLEGRFRAEDVTVTGTDAADARQKLVDQVQADQKSWTADAQAAQDAIDPFRGAILDCP
ncbi:MAG: DUF4157 domain-containing protein [Chloroflexota bacterium]